MSKRIGPKMKAAAAIVAANPGCSKKFVAAQIHPAGPSRACYSWSYGYDPINRAIKAGLIDAAMEAGRYKLWIA